jgi:hypothetical protein
MATRGRAPAPAPFLTWNLEIGSWRSAARAVRGWCKRKRPAEAAAGQSETCGGRRTAAVLVALEPARVTQIDDVQARGRRSQVRNSRSTRLRLWPAFLTACFTAKFRPLWGLRRSAELAEKTRATWNERARTWLDVRSRQPPCPPDIPLARSD